MGWVSCVEFVLKQVGVSSSQACLPNFPYVVKCKFNNGFKTNLTTCLAKCSETQEGNKCQKGIFGSKEHTQSRKSKTQFDRVSSYVTL